jgi:hypothetical protein
MARRNRGRLDGARRQRRHPRNGWHGEPSRWRCRGRGKVARLAPGRLPGASAGGARECDTGHPFCCDRTTGAFVDGDCDRKTGILTCGADDVSVLIGGLCALNGIEVDACDELEDLLCDGMGLKCTEAVRCGTTCTCDPPYPGSNPHPGDERLRWHCVTLAC